MCQLCESNQMQDDGRKIIKVDNTYILEKWQCEGFEIDDTYSKLGEIEITSCPDCLRILK